MRLTASSTRGDSTLRQHRIGDDQRWDTRPEHLDLDLGARLQLDGKVGVSQILLHREAVGAAAEATDHAAVERDGLTTVDREVVTVTDRQRAQPSRDLTVDPRPLLSVHAESEPGLIRVVEKGEVGPVVPVALLHAERVEGAIAARPDPVLLACRHQPVPYLAGPRRLDVELPAELADVRDALGEHARASDPDHARLHEGKRGLGDVVTRHALDDGPRMWSPDADHRQILRGLADIDGRIALPHLQAEPSEIAVHVAGAGDDAKSLRLDSGDGHVRRHAAVPLQQLRVDDAAHGAVDRVARRPLEERQGARPPDLDRSERAHVDDARPLAERPMLLRQQVEPRRPGPAETALVGARAAPWAPGLEVLRPFPAVLGTEDGAEILQPRVQ